MARAVNLRLEEVECPATRNAQKSPATVHLIRVLYGVIVDDWICHENIVTVTVVFSQLIGFVMKIL